MTSVFSVAGRVEIDESFISLWNNKSGEEISKKAMEFRRQEEQ